MSITLNNDACRIMEDMKEKFIDFWIKLVECESPSSRKDCVDKAGDITISFAEELGFTSKKVPFEKSGDGVVVYFDNGSKEKPILFCAHLDTVFDVGGFGFPTVKREGDILKGPGVLDCKSGVALGLLIMYALKKIGYTKRPVKLVLTPDEEVSNLLSGYKGVEYMQNEAEGCFCAFNLEGGYKDKFTVSRFGILRRSIEITGIPAHSGANYDKGRSAIKEAAHKIIAIEKETDLGCMTFNCGTISGGSVTNIIPQFCTLGIDIRVKTEEDAKNADAILKRECEKAYVENTFSKLVKISKRPPMMFNENSRVLAELYNNVALEFGYEKFNYFHSRGGSDAAYFTQLGIPAIDSVSLEGGDFHTSNEWADISTLVPRSGIIINSILNLPEFL